MTPYENYCAQMRERGLEPTMSEPQLLEAWGIKPQEEPISFVSRKSASHRNIEPTLLNHESKPKSQPLKVNLLDIPKAKKSEPKKPKAVKVPQEPKPRYRPQKKYTDEEIKQRRLERRKAKREAFKAQGLTILGKPRVQRVKVELTDEEIRARRVRYAKNYRVKHREKHLAARRAARRRRKESLLLSASNGSVNKSPEPMSAVA